jgi:two-component system OmpR family sensor kinase
MSSIRRQLLAGLLSSVLIALLVAAMAIYAHAREEANRLFDSQLEQVAEAFPSYALSPASAPRLDDFVSEGRLVIQVWGRDPLSVAFSSSMLAPPRQADTGFVTVSTDGGDWRVFTRASREYVVQVAQPMSVRSRQAAAVALRTAVPLLFLVPLLGALVWYTVGRGLRPLQRVADEVSRRSPSALQPLSEHDIPEEVRPVIASLNGLLDQLGGALEAQRDFVADAAHALRTPVTALQLQAQLLERAESDNARAAAMQQLKHGLQRLTHLVQQLLTLARQDPNAALRAFGPVELDRLAREVVATQSVLAESRNIDLGMERDETVSILGDPDALHVLLSNLVDNAIRYTPEGGRVDVSVTREDQCAAVRVEDNGPGIPAEERARVFDRFYRLERGDAAGSGLGLAIVKNIADRHRAALALEGGKDGKGLKVTVQFPVADPAKYPA